MAHIHTDIYSYRWSYRHRQDLYRYTDTNTHTGIQTDYTHICTYKHIGRQI